MDMETSLALQSLRNRLTELENRWKSPTTAETTKTAPTQANPSGVGNNICRMCFQVKEMFQDELICRDCLAASMTPTTSQSSPPRGDLPELERSLAEPYLEFADQLAAMSESYRMRAQVAAKPYST